MSEHSKAEKLRLKVERLESAVRLFREHLMDVEKPYVHCDMCLEAAKEALSEEPEAKGD